MLEMCDITGVISLLNILLSKLSSSSSSSAVLISCLDLVLSVSDSALLESDQRRVFIPVGPLCERGRVTLEVARPLYENNITDLRNTFLENPNSWKTGFLRIGEVGHLRISTMMWQTSSGQGSNYMR